MRKLKLSYATSRFDSDMQRKAVNWSGITKRLSTPRECDETLQTYLGWDRDKQLAAKDVGYYIIGTFRENLRKNDHFESRGAVALDIDYPGLDFRQRLQSAFGNYTYFWHTSRRHQESEPRIRVLLPLARDVTCADEYEAMTRLLGSWYDIEVVDGISHVAAQMMFMPSVCSDGVFEHGSNDGAWVDPGDLLPRHYIDWQDRSEWPRRADEIPPETRALQVEDPRTKPGIIGAWCRAHTIYDVLNDHIAGVYEPTDQDDRWRFGGGAGGAGALVYDDGLHLYSHHTGHDPAAGRSMNAWDIVRIHKFGERDRGVAKDTKPTKLPSFEAMTRFASADKAVIAELDATSAFDDLGDDDAIETGEGEAPERDELDDLIDAKADKGPSKADIRAGLRELIAGCDDADALIDDVLPQIAVAGISSSDTRALLTLIDDRRDELNAPKIGARALQQDIKAIREKVKGESPESAIVDLETALVKRVLREHFDGGRTLKYFAKLWWRYADGVWAPTEDPVIGKTVMKSLLNLKSSNKDEFDKVLAELRDSGRDERLGALVNSIKDVMMLTVAEDGTKDPLKLQRRIVPCVVNCANGELWIDHTGEVDFRAHSPDSLLTHRIQAAYDPEATCPTWDAALLRVFGNSLEPEELARHFHEVMGYLLQPTREIAAWVLMKGPGGNGKSFLMSVIHELLGGACLSGSVADIGGDSHFTHSLVGKLLFIDDDFAKNTLLPDGWVKKLSEAKPITANPKFGGTYTLMSRAVITILSNSWPHTRDLSEGLRRRALVFEMPRSIPESERDPRHLEQILVNELPGVLNHLIAGWRRVIKRGYRFDAPMECIDAKTEWLDNSNPAARFVNECMTRTDGKHLEPGQSVYDAYRAWVMLTGDNIKALGRTSFYAALREVGVAMKSRQHQWFVEGWRLREPPDEDDAI